jgi:peptide subunit release factor 1 (eRF1)
MHELELGRVKALFLGTIPDVSTQECADCLRSSLEESTTCVQCRSADVYRVPAEEIILRKALATDVEILAPEEALAKEFGGIAATLRYCTT